MGKKLVTNLEDGVRAVQKRMQQVIEAIAGEVKRPRRAHRLDF